MGFDNSSMVSAGMDVGTSTADFYQMDAVGNPDPSSISPGGSSSWMDPKSLGGMAKALQVGGAITSGVGSYYQTTAQKSVMLYQSSVAQSNADMAERVAQSTLLQGQQAENRVQLNTAGVVGTQRAALASSGVDLNEGSASRVLDSTQAMGDIDAHTTAANAIRSAWGYRMQAVNYQNEADYGKTAAGNLSPVSSGVGSLLSGAGAVANSWYKQDKAGV
jgi:hypothetical protein